MSVYRNCLRSKIITALLFGGLTVGGLAVLAWKHDLSIFEKLSVMLTVLIGPLFIYTHYGTALVIDEKGVCVQPPRYLRGIPFFWRTVRPYETRSLQWNEVEAVIMVLRFGLHLRVIPRHEAGKKDVMISLSIAPEKMIKVLVARLDHNAQIYLDNRLKVRLEGKQNWFDGVNQMHRLTKQEVLSLGKLQS